MNVKTKKILLLAAIGIAIAIPAVFCCYNYNLQIQQQQTIPEAEYLTTEKANAVVFEIFNKPNGFIMPIASSSLKSIINESYHMELVVLYRSGNVADSKANILSNLIDHDVELNDLIILKNANESAEGSVDGFCILYVYESFSQYNYLYGFDASLLDQTKLETCNLNIIYI